MKITWKKAVPGILGSFDEITIEDLIVFTSIFFLSEVETVRIWTLDFIEASIFVEIVETLHLLIMKDTNLYNLALSINQQKI